MKERLIFYSVKPSKTTAFISTLSSVLALDICFSLSGGKLLSYDGSGSSALTTCCHCFYKVVGETWKDVRLRNNVAQKTWNKLHSRCKMMMSQSKMEGRGQNNSTGETVYERKSPNRKSTNVHRWSVFAWNQIAELQIPHFSWKYFETTITVFEYGNFTKERLTLDQGCPKLGPGATGFHLALKMDFYMWKINIWLKGLSLITKDNQTWSVSQYLKVHCLNVHSS